LFVNILLRNSLNINGLSFSDIKMNNTSLSNLRVEMARRCPAMPANASANEVMLWASLYIERLEEVLTNLMKEENGNRHFDNDEPPTTASIFQPGVDADAVNAASPDGDPASSSAAAAAAAVPQESPKVVSTKNEALFPFGSPHSALREINRNLERNQLSNVNSVGDDDDDAELAELLDKDSFLLDLLHGDNDEQ